MSGLYTTWISGLFRRQPGRTVATIVGIAITVALIASITGFFAIMESTMTQHAISNVPVDWQVQLAPGTDPAAASAELAKSPGFTKLAQVGYFTTPGFQATTGDTVQTTGSGVVLGLEHGYREAFPAEIRDLLGHGSIVLAQQTAANLHAVPGTVVAISRPGLDPVNVTIEGVIDLPFADPLFQTVGAPVGAAPQAPPDNVLILPLDQWHSLFDPLAQSAPEHLHIQLHAAISHDHLPTSPTGAYTRIVGEAKNYEARLAGSAIVGNNLAAQLDAARSDALYARVLVLFLGLPGVLLAIFLTSVLVGAGSQRRRRMQALLRLRGASTRILTQLAIVEGLVVGVGGSVAGLILSALIVRASFGLWGFGTTLASTLFWGGIAALTGLFTALAMIVIPAWRDARYENVAAARVVVRRRGSPWWEVLGLDGILLGLSLIIYWQAGRHGYQVVVAPEGVPSISVSYTSFFAPFLLWLGVALLVVRLTRMLLSHQGVFLASLLRPFAYRLSPLISASLSRQRGRIATGLVLVALAIAFSVSTSIFNSTYEAQAQVDAELSNGADVTITGGTVANLRDRQQAVAQIPGVMTVEPMQHRYGYVGNDLQDLYGISPSTLPNATRLSDAYFVNGTARELMNRLAQTPNGILVSPETVLDFQLQQGDTINIRLQNATDQQYHAVSFTFVGIAREFPTAPSDSFLVANADYVASATGSSSIETLLVKTSGSPQQIGDRIRQSLGSASGVSVRDIHEVQRQINSGLTSVSLRGLTRIELAFGVVLSTAGAGIVLFLGLENIRRTLAITRSLGATPRQVARFVWSEAGVILMGGLVSGAVLGWGLAFMLTKLLTGVFDPPPEAMTVPWSYLGLVTLATIVAIVLAGHIANRNGRRHVLETIRSL